MSSEKLSHSEIGVPAPEELERGSKLVEACRSLKKAFDGVEISIHEWPTFSFSSLRPQSFMIVVPSSPIETREITEWTGRAKYTSEMPPTSQPFRVVRFSILGLVDYEGGIHIVGTGPRPDSPNQGAYDLEYDFNPSEHQIAIVDQSTR